MDYHFTAEELAGFSGIEDETFPEMDFPESPSQSCSSPISPRSSPQKSEEQEVKCPHPGSGFPEELRLVYDGPFNGSVKSDRRSEASHSGISTLNTVGADSLQFRPSTDRELRTPRARIRTDEDNKSRNVPLTYPTPDFSKVKSRVHLPKGNYKPPVSRGFSRRESLSFDTTYMSPADIVREVLLSTSEGSSDPSAPSSTVPQDFRCRQEAITLVEQLQDDHNRLRLEHAKVNNTIDVLQLKAKMQSRLSHDTSEVMALDFPRAQRAEINSGYLHPDGHRAAPGPYVGEQLAKILDIQTDKFLQQLQIYEDLLKRKQLKPSEQIEGLSQLNEGLDSLERAFLFAREEHKLLQQRGEVAGHFDQEQELGGLIFQCGMRMDKLKEQVEGKRQGPPTCEAPPYRPPHPTPPSVPSDDWGWSVPQSPLVPLLVDPGSAAELEVSPASAKSDDEETDDEDTLTCQYLKPLTGKQRRAEQDFAAITDHYGSFQELPRTFDHILREAEGERFHSSSLSNFGETPESERRNSNLQPGSSPGWSLERTLYQQDGVISPETDSGFIGSERCRLNPSAGPSPLHQGASQSYLVHQDGSTRKPQTVSASSPPSSPIHRLTGAESRGASWALSPEPTSRGRQRRRSSSCSPQRWVGQTERTRADIGARLERDSSESPTVSEDGHSDQSSTTAQRHHGKSPGALFSNAPRNLETKVPRLEERNNTTLSPVRAAPSAVENHTHLYTSTPAPRSRPVERCPSNVRKGRTERQKAEEVEECKLRPTAVERSPCVDRRPPQRDIFAGSDPEPQSRISRRTQTSSAAPGSCCSRTNSVQSNETHPSPAGGSSESTPTSSTSGSCQSPLCGYLQPNRDTNTDCYRDSAPRASCQSAGSPDRAVRRTYHAIPAPSQCMLGSSPLLQVTHTPSMSLLPVHVSPSNSPGTPSGVRGHKEARGRTRPSISVAEQIFQDNSLNIFLDKAIRMVKNMRRTTRHMARSVSAGMQFQERRTQSTLQTLASRPGSAADTQTE